MGSKLEAGSQTSIKVSGFSIFQSLLNDILWAAGLIAVAGITAVYLNTRRKVGKSVTSEVVGQLQREIQATEITLSQLEVDYKQGAISQEIYKTLKRKYSDRKADAQEKLTDLKMGDKPGSEEGG